MAYYIATTYDKGKAQQLCAEFPHVRLLSKPEFLTNHYTVTVCVVDNGTFEAAVIVTDAEMFAECASPEDTRPKTWLVMPRVYVDELIGLGRVPVEVLRLLP